MAATVSKVSLQIPRFFKARSYQWDFIEAMRAGCRRAMLVWHRRAGKDATTLNMTIERMLERAGTYYYFWPTYAQAKKGLWDGIQKDGMPFLRHFPEELIVDKNETEMKITLGLGNGLQSTFQLIGADNIDSIVGTNPIGCVFSEYSLMSPRAWDLMRPVLAENGGWSVFVFTPRGHNWAAKLWKSATQQTAWYTSLLDVTQTVRDSELDRMANDGRFMERVITDEAIQQERRDGMSEELVQQEFYCSFEGAMQGSYYGDLMEAMRKEGRIGLVPYNADLLVDTAWDLGVDDETVVGFWQSEVDRRHGRRVLNLIDIEKGHSHGLEHYWKVMQSKPYTYGRHYGPHDLKVQEFGSGNTRLQTAAKMGLYFEVVPKIGLADGINATRRMLPHVYVDDTTCEAWINDMVAYRREFDDDNQTFRNQPKHDRASHSADMTRYRAVAYQSVTGRAAAQERTRPSVAESDYDLYAPINDRARKPGDSDYSSQTRWRQFGA